MNLAIVYARFETLQLRGFPAYWSRRWASPRRAPPLRTAPRAGRAGALPGRVRRDGAAHVAFFQFGVGIAAGRATPWESYLRTLPVTPGHGWRDVCSPPSPSAPRRRHRRSRRDDRLRGGAARLAVRGLVVGLLLGSMPFAFLGIALGYWLSPRAALPVANLLFLPLAIAGSLWARPDDGVPHEADVASQLLPTRAGSRSSTRSQPATTRCPSTTSRRSPSGALRSSPSRGGATGATRASGSGDRYQTERRRPATSSTVAGRGFACAPGPLHDRRRDGIELRLRDPEVPQPLEPAEPRELLEPRGGIVGAERGAEARDGVGHRLGVEPDGRRQANRVHRALRQAVAAAERLGHRVTEASPDSASARAAR